MIKAEFYSQSRMESASIYLKALKRLSYYYVLDKQDGDHVLTKLPRAVTSSKKLWHGDYCCVPDCKKSSGSNMMRCELGLQRISFHCFPNIKSAKGKLWIKMIRRDPGTKFVVNKYTKICSAHFKPDDFILPDELLEGGRRRLKNDAVPSIFPWHDTNERKSLTSQQPLDNMEVETSDLELSCDILEPVCDLEPTNTDLLKENSDLKLKLTELQNQFDKSFFRLDNIKEDDSLIRLYTGFLDYETLIAFYEEILEPDASVMRQWSGKRSEFDYDEAKVGPSYKLPLIEQFF